MVIPIKILDHLPGDRLELLIGHLYLCQIVMEGVFHVLRQGQFIDPLEKILM